MSTASHADPKRRALGRGLEALLPSTPKPVAPLASEATTGNPLNLPLDAIERNPYQTRTHFDEAGLAELAQSISAVGVIQPILVRPLTRGRYQLIAGERRLLASRQAGRPSIPSIVRAVSDEQAMEMTVIENLQRADLNPMEQARAYDRLAREFKMTQEQMAQRTGKERASVANFLRLLRLPEQIQKQVEEGQLSFGHARALLALETPAQILSASQKVLALSMSVRQTESYIKGLLHPEKKLGKPEQPVEDVDPNVREAQTRLQRALGLKVRIEDQHGRGRVIIDYSSLQDFDLLLSVFTE